MTENPVLQQDSAFERSIVWDVAFQWATSDMLYAHTSGSTGSPKHIRLPMETVKKSAWRTIRFFGLNENSHLHSCVSARFIGGKMMVARAMELGCRFSFEIPSNRPRLADAGRLDLLAVVPSMMWDIAARHKSGTSPEIRNIIVGGAPIPDSLRKTIAESGLNAYETYGMTETASHIALRRINKEEIPFTVLEGIEISTDGRGCLVIKQDECEPLTTNDIAEIISDREFRILGRADNVIITGGRKVHPEDIEKRIGQTVSRFIPGDFIITSRPSQKWGEEVILQVNNTPPSSALVAGFNPVPAQLAEALAYILAPHERPHAILAAPIVYTPTGKPIRHSNRDSDLPAGFTSDERIQ